MLSDYFYRRPATRSVRSGSIASVNSRHCMPESSPSRSIQRDQFFEGNSSIIQNIKRLLSGQQRMRNEYRQWCNSTKEKIRSVMTSTRLQMQNFLEQQQNEIISQIEREYVEFVRVIEQIKEGVRQIYRQKVSLSKDSQIQNRVNIKNQQLSIIGQYYSPRSENPQMIHQFKKQNHQRQAYKQTNQFYHKNQQRLEGLNRRVVDSLNFRTKMEQKEDQLRDMVEQFKRAIGRAINNCWQQEKIIIRQQNYYLNQPPRCKSTLTTLA